MTPILYAVIVPIIAGTLVLTMPKRAKAAAAAFSFVIAALTFLFTIHLFTNKPLVWNAFGIQWLRMDTLAAFITLFIGFFGLLIILYSAGFMNDRDNAVEYYAYALWTIGASIGAAVSNNLILFLAFWGFLGFTLYLLIGLGGERAKAPAKKSFIIIGGSDALMILGAGILWKLTGSFTMSEIYISANTPLAIAGFVALALGAFAKAGAMPMHTWIPASAEAAPPPVMALLPASLDKLLGIYFMVRLSLGMFFVEAGSPISIFLLLTGAITIIAAVMMALVQRDIRKLLSYCAVSQVGYMVLGIGTANPIGIAGGLFHMLNHAIYKSCLFLSAGAVEKQTGETDLDRMGGLARYMPLTFIACSIAALSISGVPPFNGFVSKWMVYQGVIEMGRCGGKLWVICLVAAMFGSALTLASFMKLIHAVFLGRPYENKERKGTSEVGMPMWLPMVTLASLCVLFGVFAFRIPLKWFIAPSLGSDVSFTGVWSAPRATILIGAGLVVGFIIYLLGTFKTRRESDTFVGGDEVASNPDMRISGVSFYETVKDLKPIGLMYKKAEAGWFDIYEIGKKTTFSLSKVFRYLHNGILPTYLSWCLLGVIILFFIFKG
ncbi:MAG: proton-conducting transporter membrane subunit [Candidatus Omnitrophota bacterium]